MDDINKSTPQKLCPTCGSRVSDSAQKCSVCGKNLTQPVPASKAKSAGVSEPRLPEITLNLPIALGILILVLAIGAIITFFALKSNRYGGRTHPCTHQYGHSNCYQHPDRDPYLYSPTHTHAASSHRIYDQRK